MTVSYDDFLRDLPDDEIKAIEDRGAQLIQEEATLRELREITAKSQEELAKKLNVKQAAISKLERRTDIYISSLRNYIEALGGKLTIIAELPGRAPIQIRQFQADKDDE